MNRLRSILGYSWAGAMVPFLLAMFFGWNVWSSRLVRATGVGISPWYTGGEVARTVDHGAYRTSIHRPVFDGLIGQRREGFVQVDWKPAEEGASLAVPLTEELDLDGDGTADCRVTLPVGKEAAAAMVPLSPHVLRVRESLDFGSWRAVRVQVRRTG
jgi:hypothetical protein